MFIWSIFIPDAKRGKMIQTKSLKCKTVHTETLLNGRFFNAGIRKQSESFYLPNSIENMVQALVHAVDFKDGWILIGGDGRSYTTEMIERTIRILAGNRRKVQKILIGLNGWIPTPAATAIMKSQNCHLGLLFTGGHHPPGEDGYLGLKLLSPPGIPIRENVIEKANRLVKSLESFSTCEKLTCSFDEIGETEYYVSGEKLTFEIIDVVSPYIEAITMMFDLPSIKEYMHSNIRMLICCSNGVTGSFANRVFVELLGVPEKELLNTTPMENFGLMPSDPNPSNYKDFMQRIQEGEYQFGAVINPDGCRCLIVGESGIVVSHSDSLAIVAANSQCIPLFLKKKLESIVRSICTSQAVDEVAESMSIFRLEVPVGWQHWSTAMISSQGKSTLFGEESGALGVSTESFCGDRDGLWTVLAWLSILTETKKSVKEIVEGHWKRFGRTFFGRYDFVDIAQQSLDSFLSFFREKNSLRFDKIKSENLSGVEYLDPFEIDKSLQSAEAKRKNTEIVFDIENYVYPYGFIKKSLIKDEQYQIYQIHLTEDARLIVRKSESTNSSTLRFYIEYRVKQFNDEIYQDREVILQPFIKAAMKITRFEEFVSSDIKPVFV